MKNKSLNYFCKIYGRVQGVGFRAWTKKTAEKYFLTGWVRNCDDSTVECEISGHKKNLESFLNDCLNGPLLSLVRDIYKEKRRFKKYQTFEIHY